MLAVGTIVIRIPAGTITVEAVLFLEGTPMGVSILLSDPPTSNNR
jgi:hypothetical protein